MPRTTSFNPTLLQLFVLFLNLFTLFSPLLVSQVLAAPQNPSSGISIDSTQLSSNQVSQATSPLPSSPSPPATSQDISTSRLSVSSSSARPPPTTSQPPPPSTTSRTSTRESSTVVSSIETTSISTQSDVVDSATASSTTTSSSIIIATNRPSSATGTTPSSSIPKAISTTQRTALVVSPTNNNPVQNPATDSTADPAQTSGSPAGSSSGFLHNKAAVASTFTILGLIAVAGSAFLGMYVIRRRRDRRESDEDGYFAGSDTPRSTKRVTYASSFGATEKYRGGDASYESNTQTGNANFHQIYEEDIENTLAHGQTQSNPFDPYHNNYMLPNTGIIPEPYPVNEPYHSEVLDHYSVPSPVQGPQEHVYPNYGATTSGVALYSTPHPAEINPYEGMVDTVPTGQGLHPADAYNNYNQLTRQAPLQRGPSARANKMEWGMAH